MCVSLIVLYSYFTRGVCCYDCASGQVNRQDPVSGFAGIPVNMTTLPSKMAALGYKTSMTGSM